MTFADTLSTVTRSALAVVALLVMTAPAASARIDEPTVIRLWDGRAPGTQDWIHPERVTRTAGGEVQSLSNVIAPTLTVYLPDPATANGTAVMILPGGGLRALGWDSSVQQAKWLNDHGVAAIILKYRTLQMAPPDPAAPPPPRGAGPGLPVGLVIRNANANPDPTNPALTEVLAMATADAERGMAIIRRNAAEWRIDPARVGMMGFSAGGGVAVGATLGSRETAPDFLISLFGPALQDVVVPADAPPLFIAVSADHQPVANGLIALHSVWKEAGKSSEIHIYDGVRQGLGTWGGDAPVEQWPDRLLEWMSAKGLLPPVTAAH